MQESGQNLPKSDLEWDSVQVGLKKFYKGRKPLIHQHVVEHPTKLGGPKLAKYLNLIQVGRITDHYNYYHKNKTVIPSSGGSLSRRKLQLVQRTGRSVREKKKKKKKETE